MEKIEYGNDLKPTKKKVNVPPMPSTAVNPKGPQKKNGPKV